MENSLNQPISLYTCYFYNYYANKEDAGEDPYEESYKLSFDNLKDAIIATLEDRKFSADCKDYGGAVVVNNKSNETMFEIMRNGDIEGGCFYVYPEVEKIFNNFLNS